MNACKVRVLASGSQEHLDLGLGQILALPIFAILASTRDDCR